MEDKQPRINWWTEKFGTDAAKKEAYARAAVKAGTATPEQTKLNEDATNLAKASNNPFDVPIPMPTAVIDKAGQAAIAAAKTPLVKNAVARTVAQPGTDSLRTMAKATIASDAAPAEPKEYVPLTPPPAAPVPQAAAAPVQEPTSLAAMAQAPAPAKGNPDQARIDAEQAEYKRIADLEQLKNSMPQAPMVNDEVIQPELVKAGGMISGNVANLINMKNQRLAQEASDKKKLANQASQLKTNDPLANATASAIKDAQDPLRALDGKLKEQGLKEGAMKLSDLKMMNDLKARLTDPKATQEEKDQAATTLRQLAGKTDDVYKIATEQTLDGSQSYLVDAAKGRATRVSQLPSGAQSGGATAKSSPVPDKSQLKTGQAYQGPDGKTYVWNGKGFTPQ